MDSTERRYQANQRLRALTAALAAASAVGTGAAAITLSITMPVTTANHLITTDTGSSTRAATGTVAPAVTNQVPLVTSSGS